MDWMNELNTIDSRHRGLTLTWEEGFEGPQDNCIWWAVVFVNGMEYGRGRSNNKKNARAEASRYAVEALHQNGWY